MHSLEKLKPVALLLLRWVMGIIFIYHGYPKLFGKTQTFIEAFARLGLSKQFVYAAGVVELFGGGLLLLGLFTRAVSLLLLVDMIVAMWKFNLNEGVLAVRDYELPLTLAAAALILATVGPGVISLDQPIFRGKSRPKGRG